MNKVVHVVSEKRDLIRAVGLLARFDIALEGVKDDTFLAAYLLDPNRSKYDLAELAREALGVEDGNNPAANWSDRDLPHPGYVH